MNPPRFVRRTLAAAGCAALVALGALPATAQQTGEITGEVVDATTMEPLQGAQVFVPGTEVGALTNANGRFLLLNVPAGEQTVEVERIGFESQSATVTVSAGGTASVNFELESVAVALDELVVTGQGREARRRELGTTLASVDVDELATAPVQNFSQLLQGRSPGVNVLPGGGKTGQASKILLRGPGSFSQGVTPVVYVDGVRMDNSNSSGVWTGGESWSGLDDINPADIERVEIVKGAAASTIYGTEASAGVIQIFTKRGEEGRTRWNYRGEAGVLNTPRDWWNVSVHSDWFYDSFVSNGRQQEHQLSASGGSEGYSYYASGTYRDETGVLPGNSEDYGAFRGNLQLLPHDDVVVRLNTGYSTRTVAMPQDANNIYGYGINGLAGGEDGLFMSPYEIEDADVAMKSGRLTSGVTVEYNPFDNFDNRVTIGADIVNADNTEFQPYGFYGNDGRKVNFRRDATTLNLEYVATFRYDVSDAISSTLTGGLDAIEKQTGWARSTGRDFPTPGLSTVNAAAVTEGEETRLTTQQAGFFLEEQVGINELLFLRLGARADGHSAFGEDYPYEIYPNASVSYVISDQEFWPEEFGSLRLRTAYGTAGQQPGAFDAVRTWSAVSALDGVPAVTPANVGNAELAPEVSHEFEAGFDAGLVDDRLGIEFTYYRKRTEGALLPVQRPPSDGFEQEQLENVGEIVNQGFELSVDGTLVERRGLRWNAGVNLSTNDNEVTDMGDQEELYVHWTQVTREGYPIGAFIEDRYVVEDGEVVLKEDDFIGPAFPTRNFQLTTDLSIGERFNVRGLLDHAGGHYAESATVRWLMNNGVAAWCENPGDELTQTICDNAWPDGPRGNVVQPADYWKLRELSVSYNVPNDLLAGVGFRSGQVYLSGRNLWRSQKTRSMEAEGNYASTRDLSAQEYFITPMPRQLVAGVRVGF